ncbi:MAG: phosphoenolpyruvate synthase, partial [Bacteroidales bacterium]|nr:phosphoenolpyruvate synthase [Bacteroidales bacterium]
RPISEFAEDRNASAEAAEKEMGQMLIRSSKALGAGRIAGMRHIMYVPPKRFDNARTKEMRDEIARFNEKMKAEYSNYLLVGPGRWGSSDPWLGIPVVWSDISEAKMIVECAIPGYQIEPSQGTHFFQNITSLGVGYLTIDTVNRDGEADFDALDSLPAVDEGEYVRLIALDAELVAVIDRKSGQAVVGL